MSDCDNNPGCIDNRPLPPSAPQLCYNQTYSFTLGGSNAAGGSREYQGWDGGPAPSKLSLLFRPVLFSGAVVFGGLGLAAIYRDVQYRKQSWVWPARRQATALDVMGWRFTVPQLVCGSLIAGLFE